MTDENPMPAGSDDVPDEYAMNEGERPSNVRRRNRITGLLLLLLIAVIVGITVYSRSQEENSAYNEVGEPAEGLSPSKRQPKKFRSPSGSEDSPEPSNP